MMFSVMSDKEYAICNQAKEQLQQLIFSLDLFFRKRPFIQIGQLLPTDDLRRYYILRNGGAWSQALTFNVNVEKFNGFYLSGSKISLADLLILLEQREWEEESETELQETPEGPDEPDLTYPTSETLEKVAELERQHREINRCIAMKVCPKCGTHGTLTLNGFDDDDTRFSIVAPQYYCTHCGWEE